MIQLPFLLAALLGLTLATAPDSAGNPATPEAAPITINKLDAPARLTVRQPSHILRAEEAARVHIDYTPGAGQTWYFDAAGNPADSATPGGFYRNILGTTADGRAVGQDFYQDSGKAQTAPFILTPGADPHSFTNDSIDSKVVWYREDGSISAIQDYRNGTPTSRWNYYRDGILALQLPPENDSIREDPADPYLAIGALARGLRFYYPDGSLMSFGLNQDGERSQLLYRADGSPLIALLVNDETGGKEISTWDENGNFVPQDSVHQEVEAIVERQESLLDAMNHDAQPLIEADSDSTASGK